MVYYTKVGETLSDGIFAWITIGVDLEASVGAQAASTVATGSAAETNSSTESQDSSTTHTTDASPSDSAAEVEGQVVLGGL